MERPELFGKSAVIRDEQKEKLGVLGPMAAYRSDMFTRDRCQPGLENGHSSREGWQDG